MADTYFVDEVEDQEAWDSLVERSTEGTVFSSSAWLACAQAAAGGDVRRLGCFKNGHLVGGCGFIQRNKAGLKKATTPLLTPYGGIVTVPPHSARPALLESQRSRIVAELIVRLAADFHQVQLFHGIGLNDMREFVWRRWTTRELYTYLIDLRDLDQLWGALLERRTKNAVRKAEKSGFSVDKTDDVGVLLELYGRVYKRQRRAPPVPSEAVAAFYEAARKSGLVQMYVATDSTSEPASACVVLLGSDRVYAWISGADPEADKLGASSLLYWRVLEDTSACFDWFDFVGANMPSIAKFKRGFGGTLHTYYATEKRPSPIAAAAIKAYGFLHRLRNR